MDTMLRMKWDDGEEVVCTRVSFIVDNHHDEDLCEAVRAMQPGESRVFGGGAEPVCTISVLPVELGDVARFAIEAERLAGEVRALARDVFKDPNPTPRSLEVCSDHSVVMYGEEGLAVVRALGGTPTGGWYGAKPSQREVVAEVNGTRFRAIERKAPRKMKLPDAKVRRPMNARIVATGPTNVTMPLVGDVPLTVKRRDGGA